MLQILYRTKSDNFSFSPILMQLLYWLLILENESCQIYKKVNNCSFLYICLTKSRLYSVTLKSTLTLKEAHICKYYYFMCNILV